MRILAPLLLLLATPAAAQSIAAPLQPIAFLLGHWDAGKGQVADTGGTSTGRSTITIEANGGALVRRDHTDLFDKAGKPMGGFDQIMLIYPEGDTLRADYSDGNHIIHYAKAEMVAGKSVTFTSAAQPGAPTFRLAYDLRTQTTLAVSFAMAPPGSSDFHPIATGTLTKAH